MLQDSGNERAPAVTDHLTLPQLDDFERGLYEALAMLPVRGSRWGAKVKGSGMLVPMPEPQSKPEPRPPEVPRVGANGRPVLTLNRAN